MRIAFLVGSIEPGKSGVGDYTRVLAGQCVALGNSVTIVALADGHAHDIAAETQSGIATLRLSSRLPAARRRLIAEKHLAEFAPDFVSLQFVAYSFNTRGIVHDIDSLLPRLPRVPLHVMMHELWVGAEQGAPFKDRLLGLAQRHFTLAMLKRHAPRIVHASVPAYVARLVRVNVAAKLLPMLNTIPINESPDADAWFCDAIARSSGLADFQAQRDKTWVFVLFGAVYPAWQTEPLFSQLERAARRENKNIVVVSVGNQSGGRAHWANIVQKYAGRFAFVTLGERDAAAISWALRGADVGLSTSPWLLVGKSAATAVMLAHGLPVLVSRDDVHYPALAIAADEAEHSQLYRMSDSIDIGKLARAKVHAPCHTPQIVARFVADLAKAQ